MGILVADTVTPNTRTLDLASEVRKQWGPEFFEPDVAYKFSNGREFKSSDASDSGIYGVTVP